jgi:hypothetical protein
LKDSQLITQELAKCGGSIPSVKIIFEYLDKFKEAFTFSQAFQSAKQQLANVLFFSPLKFAKRYFMKCFKIELEREVLAKELARLNARKDHVDKRIAILDTTSNVIERIQNLYKPHKPMFNER